MSGLIEQAKEIYTRDAVDALKLVYRDLHQSPWDRIRDLPEIDETDAEDDD